MIGSDNPPVSLRGVVNARPTPPRRSTRRAAAFVLVVASAALPSCRGYSVDGDRPPFLDELASAPPGRDLGELLERGARTGENFRRSLLLERDGVTLAREIGELVVRFTQEAPPSLAGRPSLAGFDLSAAQIEARIIGLGALSAAEAYGRLGGKWFGRGHEGDVDQHYGDVMAVTPPESVAIPPGEPPVAVESWQYAWAGDAYVLQLLAAADLGGGARRFLLGYVTRFQDGDPHRAAPREPRLGVLVGPGRLLWISPGEVMLEECSRGASGGELRAVTGFRYRTTRQALRAEKGFQTLFTRDRDDRPPPCEFPLRLEVIRRSAGAHES